MLKKIIFMRILAFHVKTVTSMENMPKVKDPQKAISNGHSANQRPLYNSYVAKVSAVK